MAGRCGDACDAKRFLPRPRSEADAVVEDGHAAVGEQMAVDNEAPRGLPLQAIDKNLQEPEKL